MFGSTLRVRPNQIFTCCGKIYLDSMSTSELLQIQVPVAYRLLTRKYCNSFQELDLSAEAYIVLDGSKEEEWTRAISESLGSGYQKVVSKQLIGLLIIMFASTEHAQYVKEVSTQSAGCGIMGMLVRISIIF